jgi:uncharacterized protein YkwD
MYLHKVEQSMVRAALKVGLTFVFGFTLPGCVQVVITGDGKENKVSVQVQSPLSAQKVKPPHIAAQSQSIEQMEAATRNLVNAERKKRGLPELKHNVALTKIARDYSRRMRQENFFAHNDPRGKSAADRVIAAHLTFRMVGENLVMNVNAPDPIKVAVNGWMKSKGHRENILRKEFTESGLGIWKDGRTYYFTQIFLRR